MNYGYYSPILFCWGEPMVNHHKENNRVSFSSAVWGQTHCVVSVSLDLSLKKIVENTSLCPKKVGVHTKI